MVAVFAIQLWGQPPYIGYKPTSEGGRVVCARWAGSNFCFGMAVVFVWARWYTLQWYTIVYGDRPWYTAVYDGPAIGLLYSGIKGKQMPTSDQFFFILICRCSSVSSYSTVVKININVSLRVAIFGTFLVIKSNPHRLTGWLIGLWRPL